jgi:hypothetical protein
MPAAWLPLWGCCHRLKPLLPTRVLKQAPLRCTGCTRRGPSWTAPLKQAACWCTICSRRSRLRPLCRALLLLQHLGLGGPVGAATLSGLASVPLLPLETHQPGTPAAQRRLRRGRASWSPQSCRSVRGSLRSAPLVSWPVFHWARGSRVLHRVLRPHPSIQTRGRRRVACGATRGRAPVSRAAMTRCRDAEAA